MKQLSFESSKPKIFSVLKPEPALAGRNKFTHDYEILNEKGENFLLPTTSITQQLHFHL